jgi:hypothetical protein
MDARWVRRQLAVFVFVVAAAGCGGGGAGGDADASINEPPLEPPTTLGPGFTELTTSFDDVPVGDVLGMRYWDGTDQSAAVSFGFFADLDGDAAPEVILATWADGTGRSNRVYGFDPAGALVERPDLLIPPGRVFAATDLDGDGATDFLIANGGVASRPELGAPLEALGWGDAAAGFVIAPDTPHYEDLRLNYRFEVGVALADVDQDGLVDIVGGVHSGAVVTLSRGGREFEPRPDLLAGIAFAGNCGIQVASYDPAGLVMMGFGNTEAAGTRATFVRQRGYDADGYPRFEPLDAAPDEVYGNSGRVGGPSLADSAPMGGAYGDIDLDGFPDLVVTLDPVHAVMQWTGQWPLVDQTERAGFGRMKKRGLERLLLGWGTALLDIDRDGWLDVVTVHGADQQPQAGEPWPPTEQHHVTTHWSGGDFRFAEVTELTGLDKLGQWRALNFGDPDGDGDVDLIVGGYGELPRVYRNDVAVASGARQRVDPAARHPEQLARLRRRGQRRPPRGPAPVVLRRRHGLTGHRRAGAGVFVRDRRRAGAGRRRPLAVRLRAGRRRPRGGSTPHHRGADAPDLGSAEPPRPRRRQRGGGHPRDPAAPGRQRRP